MTRSDDDVTVPREPTEAMLDAGFSAYCESEGSYRDTYRAMIAAAPPPVPDQAPSRAPDELAAVGRVKIALHDISLGRGFVPVADRYDAIEVSIADLRKILSLIPQATEGAK